MISSRSSSALFSCLRRSSSLLVVIFRSHARTCSVYSSSYSSTHTHVLVLDGLVLASLTCTRAAPAGGYTCVLAFSLASHSLARVTLPVNCTVQPRPSNGLPTPTQAGLPENVLKVVNKSVASTLQKQGCTGKKRKDPVLTLQFTRAARTWHRTQANSSLSVSLTEGKRK